MVPREYAPGQDLAPHINAPFSCGLAGVGSIARTSETGGGSVAYLAHIGGFVAGLVLVKLFAGRRRTGIA